MTNSPLHVLDGAAGLSQGIDGVLSAIHAVAELGPLVGGFGSVADEEGHVAAERPVERPGPIYFKSDGVARHGIVTETLLDEIFGLVMKIIFVLSS